MSPNRPIASATASPIEALLLRSSATARARPGKACSNSFTLSASRAVTTALKPASRTAVARLWPRPDEHPVMNQVAMEKLLLCPACSDDACRMEYAAAVEPEDRARGCQRLEPIIGKPK